MADKEWFSNLKFGKRIIYSSPKKKTPCEISGSHGVEYEDDSFLEYSAV
jgi:hypothetical protein